MRARIIFSTDANEDSIVGVLKDHRWWPHFSQTSTDAMTIVEEVRNSVADKDVQTFDDSSKYVLSHTASDSRGTLSKEHGAWVTRILNDVHPLQLACASLVTQLAEYAAHNNKRLSFDTPIQIVERKSKATIIEGKVLATKKGRLAFAKSQRRIELNVSRVGAVALVALLLFTFPWYWRDLKSPTQTWIFSVFEKFIGSVAVTSMISF